MMNNQRTTTQTKPTTSYETPKPQPKTLYEYVLVKELKSGTDKNQKQYPIVISGIGERWNLFHNEKVELNKSYAFGYTMSENGQYKNVVSIIPLAKIAVQEALKEVSSKFDLMRNIGIATGYAKDLAVAKIIEVEKMFEWADNIYGYTSKKCDVEYDKINNAIPSSKDIK